MATSTLGNGTLVLAGTTSGTTTVTATAVAGTTTLTLPAATDTLVGKATTDTLTNKTLTTPSVSSPTISDGTANGVAYLNGSKVLTTGSALVFDGTNLGVGVNPTTGWYSLIRANQTLSASFAGLTTGTTYITYVGSNWFVNSVAADKYIANGFASLYTQALGQHQWSTAGSNSGGAGAALTFTQGMTLDASGRLGIGTTSPTARLSINTASSNSIAATIGGLDYSGTKRGLTIKTYQSVGGDDCGVEFNAADGLAGYGAFKFAANTTTLATIDASGNLLVGTTSTVAGAAFVVSKSVNDYLARFINSNATAYGVVVNYSGVSPNSTGQEFLRCVDSTTDRMTVRSNGGIANYSANNVNLSDRREKTNFAPAGDYLAKICAIPVQTFNYIDQNMEEDGGLTLGVVAQDVQAVAPELVMESNWAGKDEDPKMRLSIYQTDLQYALMKCIQEQQALITQLTARITALEGA